MGARRRAIACIAASKSSAAIAGAISARAVSSAAKKRAFLVGLGEFHVPAVGILHPVARLGLRENVVGAPEPLHEVFPVIRGEKGVERPGALFDQHEVVGPPAWRARVDHVMADALIAEVDLEAVVEEGEEVRNVRIALDPYRFSSNSTETASTNLSNALWKDSRLSEGSPSVNAPRFAPSSLKMPPLKKNTLRQ